VTALLVTSTGDGVDATVVIAALAAVVAERRGRCAVVLPAQTGLPEGAPGELDRVQRLVPEAAFTELVRYPEALSPAAAARTSGRPALDPAVCVQAVLDAEATADLVLVMGGGGLLVRYDEDGFTMAELARTLRLPLLVVTSAGPGTVNATALTLEVVAARGLALDGLVVDAWPRHAGLATRSHVADLEMLAARPLLGVLPAGLAAACPAAFAAGARDGLGPSHGGTFDAAAFRRSVHGRGPDGTTSARSPGRP